MSEFVQIMTLPLLACLILAGIHAYLGFHVIERQVIFVDLALAQIAVLGASLSLVTGHGLDSPMAYWLSLGFTIVGAAIFSLTRSPAEGGAGGSTKKKQRVPQEAIIGITYAVAAAFLVIVLSRSGEGDEHIRQALAGNILLVSLPEVALIAVIYAVVGVFHFIFRDKFFAISADPEGALRQGLNVRGWDFLFYVSFGIVVTSSVKIGGVLLVFSFLVVPPVAAMLFFDRLKARLAAGWAVGFLGGVAGVAASYFLDFPTGASITAVFGTVLTTLALLKTVYRRR